MHAEVHESERAERGARSERCAHNERERDERAARREREARTRERDVKAVPLGTQTHTHTDTRTECATELSAEKSLRREGHRLQYYIISIINYMQFKFKYILWGVPWVRWLGAPA